MAFIHYQDASGADIAIAFDATVRERHSLSALITEHAVENGSNISDHMRPDNDRLSLEIVISNTPIRTGPHGPANPALSHMDGATGEFQKANLFYHRARHRLPGGPTLTNPGSPPLAIRDLAPGASLAGNVAGIGGFAGFGLAAVSSVPIIPGVKPVWTAKDIEPDTGEPVSEDVQLLQFSAGFDRVKAVYDALRALKDERIKFTVVTSLRTYEDMGLEEMDVERSADIGNAFEGSLSMRQFRIVQSETVTVTQPLETRGEKTKKRGNQPTADATAAQEAKNQSTLFTLVNG